MKKEKKDVTDRGFLAKSVASVAPRASIIAIQSLGTTSVEASEKTNQMLTPIPVDTDSVQTLTNKTIQSRDNTLGGDDVYVKEFSPSGSDITNALNDAISHLNVAGKGGRILIPRGSWTTLGGHQFRNSISIEGVGVTSNGPIVGTAIALATSEENSSDYVFRITANTNALTAQNCSLKNMTIDLGGSGIGLIMTDHHGSLQLGDNIYFTSINNVQFRFGSYGIKVDSKVIDEGATTDFECIQNRFEKVSFIQCQTGFYCNSINGGYNFDTCYFQLPTSAGTALDCQRMGYMALENCLFVGISTPITAHVPPTDLTTILKTFSGFGSISFHNCQDENVQYAYQNGPNAFKVPVVYRNCLIQSSFIFSSYGAVMFDACRINITDIGTGTPSTPNPITVIKDGTAAPVEVFLRGATDLFTNAGSNTKLVDFEHEFSRVVYDSNESGLPVIKPITEAAPTSGIYGINETRGAVNIESDTSSIIVVNNRVTADTLVFVQLRTSDPGGARISNVQSFAGYY